MSANRYVVDPQRGDTKRLMLLGVFCVSNSEASDIEKSHPDGQHSLAPEPAFGQVTRHNLS
jgi:hypothetical protein